MFYAAFHGAREHWKTHHISAYDVPNVTGAEVAIPGLATPEWIAGMVAEYGGGDEALARMHPVFQVRVLGEFASTGADAVVPLGLLDEALARWTETPPPPGPLVLGVDVARFGDDESVIQPLRGNYAYASVVVPNADSIELAGRVIEVARELRGSAQPIVAVDVIGVGSGVFDQLSASGVVNAWAVDVGSSSTAVSARDGLAQYALLRDEVWFSIRDWLAAGGALPPDSRRDAELPDGDTMTTANDLISPLFDGEVPPALARHAQKFPADRLGEFWATIGNPKHAATLLARAAKAEVVGVAALRAVLDQLATEAAEHAVELEVPDDDTELLDAFEELAGVALDTLGRARLSEGLASVALFADEPSYTDEDADGYAEIVVTHDAVRARWKPETPPSVMLAHILDAARVGRLAGLPPEERAALELAEDLAIVRGLEPSQASLALGFMGIGAGRVGGDPSRFLAGQALVEQTGGVPELLTTDREWVVWDMSSELRAGLLEHGRELVTRAADLDQEAELRAEDAERAASERRRRQREEREARAASDAVTRREDAEQAQRALEAREAVEQAAEAGREADRAAVEAERAKLDDEDRIRREVAAEAASAAAGRARAAQLRALANA